MKYKKLGTSSIEVSEVCLGTMTFGEQTSEADAHSQLDFATGSGINFIDAAEMYPVPMKAESYGETEAIIGRWLKNQSRDKLVIATKITSNSRNFEWIRGGPKNVDEANIRQAVDSSLKRLQTDYIDLYQIHWPTRNQPMFGDWKFNEENDYQTNKILDQLQALAKLVSEGKIRTIGLSNEHPWGVMEFIRYSKELGLPKIETIQNAYGLLNRTFETGGLYEVCFREGVGLLPYSVLGFGHLTGKYLANPKASGRLTIFPDFGTRYTKLNTEPATKAYCQLAREHGLTPTELAHAFCYKQSFINSTIIGASNLTQVKENIAAYEVELSSEILQEIDNIHLKYPNPAP